MVDVKYNPPAEPNTTETDGSTPIPSKDGAPPIPSSDEETETPTNQGETETPETPMAEKPENQEERQPTLKEFKAMDGAKKHFEEENKKLKKQLKETKEISTPKIPTSDNPMDVVKLSKALEGYSEEEVSFITRNAENNTIDGVIEASKDEWVKGAIEAKREKLKQQESIPEPTSYSRQPGEKKIPERFDITKEREVLDDMKKFSDRQMREEGIPGI